MPMRHGISRKQHVYKVRMWVEAELKRRQHGIRQINVVLYIVRNLHIIVTL